uniref:Solute carrier family 13 member 2 n=1 Tax=Timema tahoe TaxID=61484 RepID=A0A7R9IG79_9NEOP|nr:unnamed protein product [Timema tahoe]
MDRVSNEWVLKQCGLKGNPICQCDEAKCGFVVIMMSVYWMTEAIPLPVTSLLPVVLFPLLGVLGTEEVCIQYLKETNMMFIGGLIVAIAVENCNLHKRIALSIILLTGTSPMRLMFGFMITTMVLSMWISNTATTAMMVPIVQAVLDELKAHNDFENGRRVSQLTTLNTADSDQASGIFDPETRRKSLCRTGDLETMTRPDSETICYYLGIAYASNLGGAGTLTGTGTNLTFKGLWDSLYPHADGVNFASWMLFNVPLMLVNVFASWLWLQFLFMGLFRGKKAKPNFNKDQAMLVKDMVRERVKELGAMSFDEGCTLALFIAVVLLWFFREPEFIPGWADIIHGVRSEEDLWDGGRESERRGMASQPTKVSFHANKNRWITETVDGASYRTERRPEKPAPALLHWKLIHEKVPWGLVLLLGGGFAMAEASKVSGLSHFLGVKLQALEVLPSFAILVIISTATTFLTEVSSNTAVANIVLPVLSEMVSLP